MAHHEFIRIFDSQGEAYKHAFQTFLDHTDQKRNAKRFLQKVVDTLVARNVFIDAGAGNGEVTKAFAGAFTRTIAIEPNIYQTFYYIPQEEWLTHLERLVSWMSPTGVTIVVLQHRESGCMNMVNHFFGHRFELIRTADIFRAKHGDRYEVMTALEPAHVETPDLSKAYVIAEFMLNLLNIEHAPTRQDMEAYVKTNFTTPEGTYRIPVHQDFLQIRNRSKNAEA
jgi:hypothetical protein